MNKKIYKLESYMVDVAGTIKYIFDDVVFDQEVQAQAVIDAANKQGKDPEKLAKVFKEAFDEQNKEHKVGYGKGFGAFFGEVVLFSFISLILLVVMPPVGLLTAWVLSAWHCVVLKRRYTHGDIKQKVDGEWKVSLWGWLLGPLGAGLVYGHYAGKDLNKK